MADNKAESFLPIALWAVEYFVMANGLETVKRAALETYVTLCSSDGRRLRALDERHERRCRPRDDDTHSRAAMAWLCRAHDMGADDGVSAMFSLVEGWVGSYPETTGYVIPTFYDAAKRFGVEEYCDRAREMAEWLLDCQMPDGSYPGSFVGQLAGPRVFNTGQVIFGLLRSHAETSEVRYLDAALRAGDWLLSQQDADGAWRRSTLDGIVHAYNVRTAWALNELGRAGGEDRFRAAALANADWTIQRQDDSGWFRHNTFTARDEAATLHTIAYAMQGLIEIGDATEQQQYIDCARRTAAALLRGWKLDRSLAGAYGRDWTATGDWRCLPGEAQTALAWLRLDQLSAHAEFTDAAVALLDGVKAEQIFDDQNPDIHGGITGSTPINGDYERYCLVSWGPKFLVDALLMKGHRNGEHPTG